MRTDDYRIRRWGDQAILTLDVPTLFAPFPNVTRTKNIIEARSRLPTTWTIQAFAESTGDVLGDLFAVFLDVQIGVGSGRLVASVPMTGTSLGGPLIVPASDITASLRFDFATAVLGPPRTIQVIGTIILAPFVHAPGDHKVRPESASQSFAPITDDYAHIGEDPE